MGREFEQYPGWLVVQQISRAQQVKGVISKKELFTM